MLRLCQGASFLNHKNQLASETTVFDSVLVGRTLIPRTRRLRIPSLDLGLNTIGLKPPLASFHAHTLFEMRPGPRHPLADYWVVFFSRHRFARLILGRLVWTLFICDRCGDDHNCRDSENGELHGISDNSLGLRFIPRLYIVIAVSAISTEGYDAAGKWTVAVPNTRVSFCSF